MTFEKAKKIADKTKLMNITREDAVQELEDYVEDGAYEISKETAELALLALFGFNMADKEYAEKVGVDTRKYTPCMICLTQENIEHIKNGGSCSFLVGEEYLIVYGMEKAE